ncbi:apoptosis antagonizing transcription factor-domain-containing protein [Aspergillus alliaceus]|uniref:Protein BFR2 n=1 Tax=Petromyces alliaceus TaxID=209559 RepID=A0A5N6FF81_PETAA|nr:apoptosis antagonizing transcription factor-domain-containing protein [Aspergillus alliaceus]KAB8227500.1 apoptosis antagonizing transcription factor-domain-containing protein [Aspergillus alliaceus]KAE8389219.1 apoptosis antagonizing transcription factor-domain-containing protein [Aspergillus alliaceus]
MGPKSLAEQLAELEDPTPKDFDPEDLERGGGSDSDEEGERVTDSNAGREHYQAVGKGKLRKQDPVNLGKQYAGAKVSRDALDAESDDDPFKARSSDEENGSEDEDEDEDDLELGSDEDEEMSEESDGKRPQKSRVAQQKGPQGRIADDMGSDDSEELESDEDSEAFDEDDMDDEMPSDEDEEDEDEEEDDEDDDEEVSSTRRVKFDKPAKSDDREELRRLMASDQKSITATISQAAKADAAKGRAVKQQRATFDALLNTRIKLQKGLTAINQLSVTAKEEEDLDGEAIKSAESAALTLWSTLEDLRLALADAQTQDESKKRKRPSAVTPSTSSASLWKRMVDLESDSVAHRRSILDKWSLKVRGSNAMVPNARGKLLGSASSGQQNITAVLDAQIASESGDRAAKRARKIADEDQEPIYDDTIFYQSLLRDLVEQRMSSSDAITNGIDTLHIQLPSRGGLSIHPVTGMRKDKVKRDVDTRASKGRKMRFDVHEKLQNFMAPEDRGTWTTHAREEFFASLLGKTASGMLGEGDDEDASAAEESDEDREEGGLRLFRN